MHDSEQFIKQLMEAWLKRLYTSCVCELLYEMNIFCYPYAKAHERHTLDSEKQDNDQKEKNHNSCSNGKPFRVTLSLIRRENTEMSHFMSCETLIL